MSEKEEINQPTEKDLLDIIDKGLSKVNTSFSLLQMLFIVSPSVLAKSKDTETVLRIKFKLEDFQKELAEMNKAIEEFKIDMDKRKTIK